MILCTATVNPRRDISTRAFDAIAEATLQRGGRRVFARHPIVGDIPTRRLSRAADCAQPSRASAVIALRRLPAVVPFASSHAREASPCLAR